MTEDEREILLDIFENTESPNKIKITLDPISRDVTIVYEDCDDEWFRELQSAQQGAHENLICTCGGVERGTLQDCPKHPLARIVTHRC